MNIVFKLFFLLLTCLFSIASLKASDEAAIDSCLNAYQNAKNDTTALGALLQFGELIYLDKPDSSLLIWKDVAARGRELLDKADFANDVTNSLWKLVGMAINNIGVVQESYGKIDEAEQMYLRALEINKKIGNTGGVADGWNNLGLIYFNTGEIDTAISLLAKSLAMHEQRKDLLAAAQVLNNIATVYFKAGYTFKALESYRRCLKIAESINDLETMANALHNMGYILMSQGKIERALEIQFRSLKISESRGDGEGIANSLHSLALLYKKQGEYEKALELYQRSLNIREERAERLDAAQTLSNMGVLYTKLNDNEKAVEYYQRSIAINRELNNARGLANVLNNLGSLYKSQGITELAMQYYEEALKINERIKRYLGISTVLNNMGNINLAQNKVDEAYIQGLRSLKVAEDLGFPEQIARAASLLSKIYKVKGNYSAALDMYELRIQMRDSINNDKTLKATIRQQTKYEFEKAQLVKEQEEKEVARLAIEASSRRDNMQYSVIVIVIVMVFGLVLALTRINISERLLEGMIFFCFLIFFEFLLVLADPYIDKISGGAPGIKLLFNAGIAALIFPLHAFFEGKLKKRLVKAS